MTLKRLFIVSIFFLGLLFISSRVVLSQDNTSEIEKKKQEIEQIQQEISKLNGQKQTLKSTINYLNSKIRLTEVQISQTEDELDVVSQEIKDLSEKIIVIDASLEDLTDQLLYRVNQTYKRSRINPFFALVSSDTIKQLVSRFKYLQLAEKHNKEIVVELETARTDFDQQKVKKEEKQQELDDLTDKLEGQKKVLGVQQVEKEQLLEVTNNDEKKYQQLLKEAQSQLAALSRFVTAQGGASILSNQTKCDGWGCYYNQRDSQWGNLGLGGSNYSVAEYGCLITSISMVASHYGKDLKPYNIATNPSYFVPNTGYLYHSADGMPFTVSTASKSMLDSELEAGRPVVAGLYSGPDHFIVILKKEGDDYIIHDPFVENGANKKLSDDYSYAAISSIRLISFN